jgi:hypothetical protein
MTARRSVPRARGPARRRLRVRRARIGDQRHQRAVAPRAAVAREEGVQVIEPAREDQRGQLELAQNLGQRDLG